MPAVALPTRPSSEDRLYTLEEFMAIDFDERVELVEGRIKCMGWNNAIHARLVIWLGRILDIWSSKSNWGLVMGGAAGIRTKPRTARGADLVCISFERYAQVSEKGKIIDVGPELIIEVISPSNTWNDINDKLSEYFALGAGEVWVVSPDHRKITVYETEKSSRSFAAAEDECVTSQQLPGFELRLTDMAAEIDQLL